MKLLVSLFLCACMTLLQSSYGMIGGVETPETIEIALGGLQAKLGDLQHSLTSLQGGLVSLKTTVQTIENAGDSGIVVDPVEVQKKAIFCKALRHRITVYISTLKYHQQYDKDLYGNTLFGIADRAIAQIDQMPNFSLNSLSRIRFEWHDNLSRAYSLQSELNRCVDRAKNDVDDAVQIVPRLLEVQALMKRLQNGEEATVTGSKKVILVNRGTKKISIPSNFAYWDNDYNFGQSELDSMNVYFKNIVNFIYSGVPTDDQVTNIFEKIKAMRDLLKKYDDITDYHVELANMLDNRCSDVYTFCTAWKNFDDAFCKDRKILRSLIRLGLIPR